MSRLFHRAGNEIHIHRLESRVLLSAGDLDLTYGNGGLVRVHPEPAAASVFGADFEEGFDSVVVGTFARDAGLRLYSFNGSGAPNTAFGADGTVAIPVTGITPRALAVDGINHRIAIAGNTTVNADPRIKIVMLTFTGTLDSSFGTGGETSIDFNGPAGGVMATKVQIGFQSDGALVVAGTRLTGPTNLPRGVVVRLTPAGILDPSFGGSGTGGRVGVNEVDQFDAMKMGSFLKSSGDRIFLAGSAGRTVQIRDDAGDLVDHDQFTATINVLNPDGTRDADFGATSQPGRETFTTVDRPTNAVDLDITFDGDVLLLLRQDSNPDESITTYRYDVADVKRGESFPQVLFTELDFAAEHVRADARDKILVSGRQDARRPSYSVVTRLQPNGEADLRYGFRGSTRTGTVFSTSALLMDTHSRALLAGGTTLPNNARDVVAARFEFLDDRLRAESASAVLDLGTLDVAGTSKADIVRLVVDGDELVVSINKNRLSYVLDDVQRVVVHTGKGDDGVSMGGGVRRSSLLGGDGDDTLVGGDAKDTLRGGGGDDSLVGGGNNDWLYGEFGDDSLIAGSGADRLIGGNGDDLLSGGAGTDRLTGGAGKDTGVSAKKDHRDSIEILK